MGSNPYENRIEELEQAVVNMGKLLYSIRKDWSDPRIECRAGFDIVKAVVPDRFEQIYIAEED